MGAVMEIEKEQTPDVFDEKKVREEIVELQKKIQQEIDNGYPHSVNIARYQRQMVILGQSLLDHGFFYRLR